MRPGPAAPPAGTTAARHHQQQEEQGTPIPPEPQLQGAPVQLQGWPGDIRAVQGQELVLKVCSRVAQQCQGPDTSCTSSLIPTMDQLLKAPWTLVAAAAPRGRSDRANSRRCPGGQRRPSASSRPGGCLGCTGRGAGAWLRRCLLQPWRGQPGHPAQGTAPARPGEDNPLLSWCIPAGSSTHTSAGLALPLFRAWGLAQHCKFPPLGSTATDYFPNSPTHRHSKHLAQNRLSTPALTHSSLPATQCH